MSDGVGAPPELDPGPPRRWTRRVAPLLLVAAVMIAGAIALPRIPKERKVDLRLEDPATVMAIDVVWLKAGADDETTFGGSSFRFAAGGAPRTVPLTVRLPDGDYILEVTVDSAKGHLVTRRSMTLRDAGRITVPIR